MDLSKIFKFASIGLAIVLVITVVYNYFKSKSMNSNVELYNSKADASVVSSNKVTINSIKSDSTKIKKSDFPLQYGSNNESVRALQKFLNVVYKAGIDEDKDFGDETKKSLKRYTGKDAITYNQFMSTVTFASKYANLDFLLGFVIQ